MMDHDDGVMITRWEKEENNNPVQNHIRANRHIKEMGQFLGAKPFPKIYPT